MRRVLGYGAVVMALLVPALPSRAAAPEPFGFLCSARYVPSEGTTATLEMDAELVTAALPQSPPGDLTAVLANPVSVTLRCSFQLDGYRHADPDTYSASATGTGVVVLAPVVFDYPPREWEDPVVCTEATVTERGGATTTLYYDADADEWTTDPATRCQLVNVACPDGGARRSNDCGNGFDPWQEAQALSVEYVDPAICPALAEVSPPEGDVEDLWDCPPYGSGAPTIGP